MKKSKLIFAIVMGLFTLSNVANAQSGRISVGLELALPMGNFADVTSLGYGGSLRYEHPMGDNIGLTATAGYMMFGGKEVDGFDLGDWSMIPVQVGAKYYFTENQNGFYAGVEVGVHATTYSSEDIDLGGGIIIEGGDESSTDLSYAPQIGYHLANLDLGLRYQFIATEDETTTYLGIRIAYVLGGN